MLLPLVFVIATIWTSALCSGFQFPISNSNRTTMRLTATFSVSEPEAPSVPESDVNIPSRISSNADSVIAFQNSDNLVSAEPGAVNKMITQGVSKLALDIDRTIAPEGKLLEYNENTIFSPISITTALALVMLGARGQTMREISRVLGLSAMGDTKERHELTHQQFGSLMAMFDRVPGKDAPTVTSIANGIFIQQGYPINQRFERLSRELYRSDIIPVDFNRQNRQAGQTINRWVESMTSGRIQNFLSGPPSSQTRVLLASAIYFNGAWETPFPIEGTRKRPFYVTGSKRNTTGSEVLEVDMMANGLEIPYFSDPDLGCQIAGLPYKGKQVTMYVVLPTARGFEGLNALKERLSVPVIDNLIANTRIASVILAMPRMKLEATLNLRSTLETLGVRSLFDPRHADLGELSSGVSTSQSNVRRRPSIPEGDRLVFTSRFGERNEFEGNGTRNENATSSNSTTSSPMPNRSSSVKGGRVRSRRADGENTSPNPGLFVDDVVHKVEIEVTETGTVASATTAVSISRDGSHPVVRLDRPFLFFIRHDESKLLLFWGSVIRPT